MTSFIDFMYKMKLTPLRWVVHTICILHAVDLPNLPIFCTTIHRYFSLLFGKNLFSMKHELDNHKQTLFLKQNLFLHSLKTNWLRQLISLFIMWTTIILYWSNQQLIWYFWKINIVEPTPSLLHLNQSLLNLNQN